MCFVYLHWQGLCTAISKWNINWTCYLTLSSPVDTFICLVLFATCMARSRGHTLLHNLWLAVWCINNLVGLVNELLLWSKQTLFCFFTFISRVNERIVQLYCKYRGENLRNSYIPLGSCLKCCFWKIPAASYELLKLRAAVFFFKFD